jgi:hypothetical protein
MTSRPRGLGDTRRYRRIFAIPSRTYVSCQLDPDVADCFQYIDGPLRQELELRDSKRPRRFAGKKRMLDLGKLLWLEDWHEYRSHTMRLDDWCLALDYSYTSSRIGEILESTAREGSGRGLCYRVSPAIPQGKIKLIRIGYALRSVRK